MNINRYNLKGKIAVLGILLSFVFIFQFAMPLKVNAATINATTESELADAIRSAAPGDIITIGSNITLTGDLPVIDKNITITSTAGMKLTMSDAMAGKRHFHVENGATVEFLNMTLDGNGKGGGIESHGNITVKDSEITNCHAISGAAIFSTGALTIETSNIYNNTSTSYGGGVYAQSANDTDVIVTGTNFNGNKADRGAGLYISRKAKATVTDSTFTGNTASETGGGIFADSVITVKASTIEKNTAHRGGGIFVIPSESASALLDVKIEDSTFKDNKAVDKGSDKGTGGAFSSSAANVVIDGSDFTGNDSTGTGGALSIGTGNLKVTAGSKIENNKAAVAGGGIYGEFVKYDKLDLTKSAVVIEGDQAKPTVIKGNVSEQNGGGIYINQNTTLALTGVVQISVNEAVKGNGGGIWTHDLKNVTVGKDIVFTDNKASTFTVINEADILIHKENILVEPAVFSKHDGKAADYAYNNYDINYKEEIESPKTGDTSNSIWLIMLALSSICVIALSIRSKRMSNRGVK